MSAIGGTYPAQQNQAIRNRYAAHQMHQRGLPPAEIAAVLQVATRSVFRYLKNECPPPPPPPVRQEVQLDSFYLEGACYERLDIEWATTKNKAQIAAAKAVCAQCPVLQKCRTYGLTTGLDDWGVWGGLTRLERKRAVAAPEAPAAEQESA